MANEIRASASVSARKNTANVTGGSSGTFDMAGTEMHASVQQFSAGGAASISFGGCDSLKALYIENMDDTNNLIITADSGGVTIATLPPGAFLLLMGANPSAALEGEADQSTVNAWVVAVEN